MAGHTRLLALVSLLACLLSLSSSPALGMIENDVSVQISSSTDLAAAWSFEFAAGGSLDIAVTLQPGAWSTLNQTVQVMVASDAQMSGTSSATLADVCVTQPYNYTDVYWVAQLGAGYPVQASTSIASIPSRGWVRLLVLNCAGGSFELSYSDTAVNPDGEYLSLNQIPFKKMLLAFVALWAIAAGLWAAHIFAYRKWNIGLQSVMTLMPLTRLFFALPALFYWRSASENGVYPEGLAWLTTIAMVIDRVTWVAVVYLMATGWRMLKSSLGAVERQTLVTVVVSLSAAYALFVRFQGMLVLLLMFVYVFIVRAVFALLLASATTLHDQEQVLAHRDIDSTRTPLHAKMRQFKTMYLSLIAYMLMMVTFELWATIFLGPQPWVRDAMDHVLGMMLACVLAHAFALRPFNPFYLPIIAQMLANPSLAPQQQDADLPLDNNEAAHAEGEAHEDNRAPHAPVGLGLLRHDYHRVGEDDAHAHRLPAGLLWSPGHPVPDLSGVDAGRWRAAPVAREPLLIVDAPLSTEHPLMVGRLARPHARRVASDASAVPKAALAYLPAHMRRALDAHERDDQQDARRAPQRDDQRHHRHARNEAAPRAGRAEEEDSL